MFNIEYTCDSFIGANGNHFATWAHLTAKDLIAAIDIYAEFAHAKKFWRLKFVIRFKVAIK